MLAAGRFLPMVTGSGRGNCERWLNDEGRLQQHGAPLQPVRISAIRQQAAPALARSSFKPFMLMRLDASATLMPEPAGGTPPRQCVSRLTA